VQTTNRRITLSAAVATLAFTATAVAWAQSPAKPAPLTAEGCLGCHGPAAKGQDGVPAIRGYDKAEFVKVWAQFRANERPATIMNRIARGYTDEEVAALADYFSSLK
jgi:sulfide dehydrogenase cytochrome subunit